MQAGALEVPRRAALPDGGRQADHRQGGGAARADPREPGDARRVVHHAEPVRRAAAHPAGRDRAEPPPFAVGAALHRRGRGRLHRGRRRAHHDAAGRFHHHAVVDLARPRQSRQRAGGMDGRPRHPHRADLRRAVPRGLPGGGAAGVAQRRRLGGALRPGPGAGGRARAVRQDLADLQLSVRAQPRVARQDGAGPGSRRLPRLEDGVHQPAVRRARDAHHRGLHPAAAEGIQDPALSLHRRYGVFGRRGHRNRDASAPRVSTSSRATPSWCLPGIPLRCETKGEAVLFSFSDRPGQEAMGLWREKRG